MQTTPLTRGMEAPRPRPSETPTPRVDAPQKDTQFHSSSGGVLNVASAHGSSIVGGYENAATGFRSSISGGSGNNSSGTLSSILGGKNITESTEYGVSP